MRVWDHRYLFEVSGLRSRPARERRQNEHSLMTATPTGNFSHVLRNTTLHCARSAELKRPSAGVGRAETSARASRADATQSTGSRNGSMKTRRLRGFTYGRRHNASVRAAPATGEKRSPPSRVRCSLGRLRARTSRAGIAALATLFIYLAIASTSRPLLVTVRRASGRCGGGRVGTRGRGPTAWRAIARSRRSCDRRSGCRS